MPEQFDIYFKHAPEYERLIVREDYRGALLEAIQARCDPQGLLIADIGAGTGRFARMLQPYAKAIIGLDFARPMLSVARAYLPGSAVPNWALAAADHRQLPLSTNSVDLAIAGWSFGHATVWYENHWEKEIDRSVREMLRIIRSGGTAMIFETMGTGVEKPAPPTKILATYYAFLKREFGFEEAILETDYRFASLDEAEQVSRFFFGDEMGDKVRERNWVVLPEWTGLWWRRMEA